MPLGYWDPMGLAELGTEKTLAWCVAPLPAPRGPAAPRGLAAPVVAVPMAAFARAVGRRREVRRNAAAAREASSLRESVHFATLLSVLGTAPRS